MLSLSFLLYICIKYYYYYYCYNYFCYISYVPFLHLAVCACLRMRVILYSQRAIDAGRERETNRHFAISIVAILGNVIMTDIMAERPLISSIEISCRISKNTFTQSHTRAANERFLRSDPDNCFRRSLSIDRAERYIGPRSSKLFSNQVANLACFLNT